MKHLKALGIGLLFLTACLLAAIFVVFLVVGFAVLLGSPWPIVIAVLLGVAYLVGRDILR